MNMKNINTIEKFSTEEFVDLHTWEDQLRKLNSNVTYPEKDLGTEKQKNMNMKNINTIEKPSTEEFIDLHTWEDHIKRKLNSNVTYPEKDLGTEKQKNMNMKNIDTTENFSTEEFIDTDTSLDWFSALFLICNNYIPYDDHRNTKKYQMAENIKLSVEESSPVKSLPIVSITSLERDSNNFRNQYGSGIFPDYKWFRPKMGINTRSASFTRDDDPLDCKDAQTHSAMKENIYSAIDFTDKLKTNTEQYITTAPRNQLKVLDFPENDQSTVYMKKHMSTSAFLNQKCLSTTLCLLLLLNVPVISCENHCLKYCHTGVSQSNSMLPQFMAVGYMDDQQIDSYNSDSKIAVPKTKWMDQEDSSYWKRQTEYRKGWEEVFKDDLLILTRRVNHTEGLHIFQHMYGCELDDEDGSTRGFYQYGYDGKDFISLDTDRVIWVPAMNEAQLSTQRWNTVKDIAVRVQHYLQYDCIDALNKYIQFRGTQNKVAPRVKVSTHQSNDGIKLHCHVYGFYPRDVDVKWVKNGIDDVYSEEAKQILPNPDGTYQTRVTVEVTPKEEDSYSCHVDHGSLQNILIVLLDLKSEKTSCTFISLTVPLVILVATVPVAFAVYKKYSAYKNGDVIEETPERLSSISSTTEKQISPEISRTPSTTPLLCTTSIPTRG
ncbi:uncharacterized protein O3C94_015785 isoform 2-T2 [Discoglossus pictus]